MKRATRTKSKSKQTKRRPSPKGKAVQLHANKAKLPGWRGDMFMGSEFSDEERRFCMAMDQFKKKKPFPTWRDVLGVVKSLGYERVMQT